MINHASRDIKDYLSHTGFKINFRKSTQFCRLVYLVQMFCQQILLIKFCINCGANAISSRPQDLWSIAWWKNFFFCKSFAWGLLFTNYSCAIPTYIAVYKPINHNEVFKKKKHVFHAFIAWWKLRQTFGRIREQISAWEFSQTLLRFSTGYGGMENMFYFFYEIIVFIVNKEKNAYCKFSQLGDSQTTLLTPFSCFIALWKHTCWPIKTHVLSKLFYNA